MIQRRCEHVQDAIVICKLPALIRRCIKRKYTVYIYIYVYFLYVHVWNIWRCCILFQTGWIVMLVLGCGWLATVTSIPWLLAVFLCWAFSCCCECGNVSHHTHPSPFRNSWTATRVCNVICLGCIAPVPLNNLFIFLVQCRPFIDPRLPLWPGTGYTHLEKQRYILQMACYQQVLVVLSADGSGSIWYWPCSIVDPFGILCVTAWR